jgi:hypothetical protein
MSIPMVSRDLQVKTSQIIPCAAQRSQRSIVNRILACMCRPSRDRAASSVPFLLFKHFLCLEGPKHLYHVTSYNIVDGHFNSIYPSPVSRSISSPFTADPRCCYLSTSTTSQTQSVLPQNTTSCPTSGAAAPHALSHKCASLSINKLPFESDLF